MVILVSKFDHCLNDLLYRYRTGDIPMEIPAIVSNHPDLKPLADFYGLPFHHLPVTKDTRAAQEAELVGLIEAMREGRAHALTLTSAEGLDNLMAALGAAGRALLERLPTFAAHPRIAERAREHGLSAVETAGGDAGLLAGLLDWFGTRATRASDTGPTS